MDAPASLGVPAIHFLFQRRLLSEETYIDLVLNLEFHAFIASIATDEVGRDIDGLGNRGLDQYVTKRPGRRLSLHHCRVQTILPPSRVLRASGPLTLEPYSLP